MCAAAASTFANDALVFAEVASSAPADVAAGWTDGAPGSAYGGPRMSRTSQQRRSRRRVSARTGSAPMLRGRPSRHKRPRTTASASSLDPVS